MDRGPAAAGQQAAAAANAARACCCPALSIEPSSTARRSSRGLTTTNAPQPFFLIAAAGAGPRTDCLLAVSGPSVTGQPSALARPPRAVCLSERYHARRSTLASGNLWRRAAP